MQPGERTWLATTALAVVAVILAAVTVVFGLMNQAAQDALMQRQDYAAQTPGLARFAQLVASTLGEAAQRENNQPLRDLLAKQGFTIRVNPPPPGALPPPAMTPPAVTPPAH